MSLESSADEVHTHGARTVPQHHDVLLLSRSVAIRASTFKHEQGRTEAVASAVCTVHITVVEALAVLTQRLVALGTGKLDVTIAKRTSKSDSFHYRHC